MYSKTFNIGTLNIYVKIDSVLSKPKTFIIVDR